MTKDIPSAINFHDIDDARRWADEADEQRPYRIEFFDRIAEEINRCFKLPISILEIGSGPGYLAEHILQRSKIGSYYLLDFSDAMHRMARERLEPFRGKTHFLIRDFKTENWTKGLGPYDAVAIMQSAHEVRHKSHISKLFSQIRTLIQNNGYFLMCDHCIEGMKNGNPELYMTKDGQYDALKQAGFESMELIMEKGSLVLYRANKSSQVYIERKSK